ncbi:MAG: DUF3097 family protein [Actinomycetes bacterium]
MRDRYAAGITRRSRPRSREVPVEPGLVVEDAETGWCGAVVSYDRDLVVLEDRAGRHRSFRLGDGFLLVGEAILLVAPATGHRHSRAPGIPGDQTASGSRAVPGLRARVARAGRIYVEGRHDAELVERVWGDDLRVEGVVVEAMDGVDVLGDLVAAFRPGPGRRLGVLVDHLVPGSKESLLAQRVRSGPHGAHLLIVGHPFIDIWQAVAPPVVGLTAWPDVPRGTPWKEGVLDRVAGTPGWPSGTDHHPVDPRVAWRWILSRVSSYRDLEPALIGRVEELIDFVTGG